MPKQPAKIYQIKVTLKGSRPPIWRRIQVPGNISLLKLHDILQIVMGWDDDHLHMFTIEGTEYGASDDQFRDLGNLDERKYKLSQVIHGEGQRFTYEYDFGDSWIHTLLVEKILPPEKGVRYPICLAGKRACPPEDIGGIGGYWYFLEAIGNPENENHEQYLEWYGGEFDPEAFDLEETNKMLHSARLSRSKVEVDDIPEGELETQNELIASAAVWMESLNADLQAVAENLPLRRDILALLTYVRDNKVVGTPSTGNFPLKAVHEICARFVDQSILENASDNFNFRIRSEFDVWPLYFRHFLAAMTGLLEGGNVRRWKLTNMGESFLTTPAWIQVWVLFLTWWLQVNWLIAMPWGYEDDDLPDQFRDQALTQLLKQKVDVPFKFDSFAKQLIKAGGLDRGQKQNEMTSFVLTSIVEQTVVKPLSDFGILVINQKPHHLLGEGFEELDTIQLTGFGKALLESVKSVAI